MQQTLESITALYQFAIAKHRASSGGAAAAVLDLCGVVLHARESLSETDWGYFGRKHDFPAAGSLTRRAKSMLTITAAAETFRPHVASLPPSINALTKLARLSPARLAAAVEQELTRPEMTVEDCAALRAGSKTGKQGNHKQKPEDYRISVVFITAEATPAKLRSVRRTLQAFLDKHARDLGLMPA
jgi:hypothetical protein